VERIVFNVALAIAVGVVVGALVATTLLFARRVRRREFD
jgi:hypothetical protein